MKVAKRQHASLSVIMHDRCRSPIDTGPPADATEYATNVGIVSAVLAMQDHHKSVS